MFLFFTRTFVWPQACLVVVVVILVQLWPLIKHTMINVLIKVEIKVRMTDSRSAKVVRKIANGFATLFTVCLYCSSTHLCNTVYLCYPGIGFLITLVWSSQRIPFVVVKDNALFFITVITASIWILKVVFLSPQKKKSGIAFQHSFRRYYLVVVSTAFSSSNWIQTKREKTLHDLLPFLCH